MEYSKKLENILIKLNKISQLDIYVSIEDNLLLIDIYIDYPNKDLYEYVMNTTKDTLVYLDEYKIIKGITKVSFESEELDKESSNKIYNLFNVTKARLDISFYELDKYLFDKNILVKRILRNHNIYYLEFAIDEERKYAYNYLNRYNVKVDMKDIYFNHKCKAIKLIKEANNESDKNYFLYRNYLLYDL